MSNSLKPDQAKCYVGRDLGPSCLPRLSVDDTSGQKVKISVSDEQLRTSQFRGPQVYICFNFSIEGEFVPKEGDDVTYNLCPLPMKPENKQAVHVKITHLAPGVTHETWNPNRDPMKGSPTQ